MPKRLLLFVCLFCNLQVVFAQYNETDFEHYTVINGLSDNNATCITQDASGFIWIGTETGLNSFNGETFDHYFSGSKPLYLAGSYIVKFVPFSKNRLGVISKNGFQVIDTKKKIAENYRFPDTGFISHYNNGVFDAIELPGGSVLLSSASGIYQFDKPGHISFRYDNYTSSGDERKRILYARDIIPINEYEAVIYTNSHTLDHYDFQKKKLYHVPLSSPGWSAFFPTRGSDANCKKTGKDQYVIFTPYSDSLSFYDRRRNIRIVSSFPWLSQQLNWESKVFMLNDSSFIVNCAATGYYLFKLNKKTGVINCDPKKYLSSYKCNAFFIDRDERLWVGTRTGLLRQKKKALFLTSSLLFNPHDPGTNARFSSIYRYRDKLYVGSFNRKEGLYIVDTTTMQVTKKITFFGGDNDWSQIVSIRCYHRDTLWLGTLKGLLWFDVRSFHYGYVLDSLGRMLLAGGEPVLLPADKKGRAWLFDFMNGKAGFYDTAKRSFTFYTQATVPALPFTRIKHIVYDSYGDVWIAGHGLARFNCTTNRFDSFTNVYAGPHKYNDDILAIAADKAGSLWFYNAENVLLEYKIKEKRFYEHSDAEGLPVFVQSMAEEVNDKLWFTTGSQLIGYTPATKQVVYFDQDDGMPLERASSRIIFYDKERNCYYSLHDNYLASFPAAIPARQDANDRLLVTKIVFEDTTLYDPANTLSTAYEQQNFSVYFTALNYDAPHSYNFSYSLDNRGWINLDGLEMISFNQLSSGNHQIRVKAISKFGRKLITVIFVYVSPPFWRQWWFILLVVFSIISLLYIWYNYRISQLIKLQAIRNTIARDLHDDIASTMGSINIYSEIAAAKIKQQQPVVAGEILQKIGSSSRQMMDRMSDIVWSISSTNDYLENLADRMKNFCSSTLAPNGINFYFDIPDAFSGVGLSMEKRKNIFLIFKECLHNILKYAACENVTVTIILRQNQMTMTIKDDGKGFDLKNSNVYNGNGLKNMKDRAAEMHAKLLINSIMGEGTTIELQMDVT